MIVGRGWKSSEKWFAKVFVFEVEEVGVTVLIRPADVHEQIQCQNNAKYDETEEVVEHECRVDGINRESTSDQEDCVEADDGVKRSRIDGTKLASSMPGSLDCCHIKKVVHYCCCDEVVKSIRGIENILTMVLS